MARTDDVYTHGHQEAVLRSHKWRTAANSAAYLLPRLRAGMRVLDVGCGPGTLTVDLARHVAPGGAVHGVDISPTAIAEARAHLADADPPDARVEFSEGDFRDVAGDRRFDVVHAHQVLQHLSDPVGALLAMRDLVATDGIVAVRDSDYDAMFWAPASPALERWRAIYLAVTRANRAEADAGRHLLRWAHDAGFGAVTYTTSTWTFATDGERAWWAGLWSDRCLTSTFAEQAVAYGVASEDELRAVADGWLAWARQPAAVFVVPHGEVIAAVADS